MAIQKPCNKHIANLQRLILIRQSFHLSSVVFGDWTHCLCDVTSSCGASVWENAQWVLCGSSDTTLAAAHSAPALSNLNTVIIIIKTYDLPKSKVDSLPWRYPA